MLNYTGTDHYYLYFCNRGQIIHFQKQARFMPTSRDTPHQVAAALSWHRIENHAACEDSWWKGVLSSERAECTFSYLIQECSPRCCPEEPSVTSGKDWIIASYFKSVCCYLRLTNLVEFRQNQEINQSVKLQKIAFNMFKIWVSQFPRNNKMCVKTL